MTRNTTGWRWFARSATAALLIISAAAVLAVPPTSWKTSLDPGVGWKVLDVFQGKKSPRNSVRRVFKSVESEYWLDYEEFECPTACPDQANLKTQIPPQAVLLEETSWHSSPTVIYRLKSDKGLASVVALVGVDARRRVHVSIRWWPTPESETQETRKVQSQIEDLLKVLQWVE